MGNVVKTSVFVALLLIGCLAGATEQRYHLKIDRTYETSSGQRIILARTAWYRFTLACQVSDRGACSDPDLNKTYVLVLENRSGAQVSILLDSDEDNTNLSGNLIVHVLSMDTN